MAFPFLPAGIALGASFLKGLFGHKSQKKQAEAERRSQLDADRAGRERHDANERTRATRLDMLSALLGNVQGGLGKGAPSYTLDPAMLERLKAPKPYSGALPADPRAGLGSSFLSGLFGGVSDTARGVLLGRLSQPKTPGTGAPGGFQAGFDQAGAATRPSLPSPRPPAPGKPDICASLSPGDQFYEVLGCS